MQRRQFVTVFDDRAHLLVMSPKDEGGNNDANPSYDQRRRAPVECRRLGANRDGVLERSRRGCSGQVDDDLGRKQS
jgi:hypothetical protein